MDPKRRPTIWQPNSVVDSEIQSFDHGVRDSCQSISSAIRAYEHPYVPPERSTVPEGPVTVQFSNTPALFMSGHHACRDQGLKQRVRVCRQYGPVLYVDYNGME